MSGRPCPVAWRRLASPCVALRRLALYYRHGRPLSLDGGRVCRLDESSQLENRGFDFDDGGGLRVAQVRFESESKFSWSLFDGYDRIRILTYSAGVGAIVRLLEKHGFSDFECVFGCESTLHTLKDIMAFQQVAIGDTRAAIKNLSDERHAFILSRVREGQARFRVLRKQIAHAKLYTCSRTRTPVAPVPSSAPPIFLRRPLGVVSPRHWSASTMTTLRGAITSACMNPFRDRASDEIPLPPERIENSEITLQEVPVLDPEDIYYAGD